MKNINLFNKRDFDLYQYLDNIKFIRDRRTAIGDLLNNGEIPLPEGAVLLPDDRTPAENPDLISRLSVPFVVGYKYFVKDEFALAYFLAAVKVGDEEKLLLARKICSSEVCCLSKKDMFFPEKSDCFNYGGL